MTYDRARELLSTITGVTVVDGGPPLTVIIEPASYASVAAFVKETIGCTFFAFSTAIDWKADGLEVVAWLDNPDAQITVVLRCKLGAGVTTCPSLVPVYRGAEWMERETYDMFGIVFEGNRDLRRIYMPPDYRAFPLRKDFYLPDDAARSPGGREANDRESKGRAIADLPEAFRVPSPAHDAREQALKSESGFLRGRFRELSQPGFDAVQYVVWMSLVPLAPFAALAWWAEPAATRWQWLHASAGAWASVAYLGWLATVAAYGAWTWLLKRHPAGRIAPFSLGVPVIGLAAGTLLMGETITHWQWLGSACVVLALAVVVVLPGLRAALRQRLA